jgi:hypothetical protein
LRLEDNEILCSLFHFTEFEDGGLHARRVARGCFGEWPFLELLLLPLTVSDMGRKMTCLTIS